METEEEKNKIENSGDPHEYMKKHVKDWQGKDFAVIGGELIILTEEESKLIRNRSQSNGTGNVA